MSWNRREFLKAGGLTALSLGLNIFSPQIFQRRILAGTAASNKRLIFIFQRGGNDGVNTVIPRGDPQYNTTTRPTLFIDESEALDLGNGFAQLHPMLQPMMEIYNQTGLNGVAGPGNLAVCHRIGYSGQSQSHFDSQQYWENGVPGEPSREVGIFYNQLVQMGLEQNGFLGASMSSSQLVGLNGPLAVPTISNPATFSFSGAPAKVLKFLGQLPSAPLGDDGRGLQGFFGGPRGSAPVQNQNSVFGTGLTLTGAVQTVQDALAQGPYTPTNGAVYPTGSFGDKLRNVAMLLKRTPVQILGVNIGGWDTHTGQGAIYGAHGNLLQDVAEGFRALYRDLQEGDLWQDTVIVTMTEFGRTSVENGSRGTDHAYACVVLAAGGSVKGGVYNCSPSTWAPGDLFSQSQRYVRRRTDYRAIFGEIFTKHFGDTMPILNQVIPGYSAAATQNPQDFTFLNLLA
ncbi:MAG TPA: DUF1501 domain-containing protein [Planctomycetota bacterium]|nr:DUF1501 domain-containing protein [Planctomycetota bacterium]